MKRLALLASVALAGCGGSSSSHTTTAPSAPAKSVRPSPTLHLSSPASTQNGPIPRQYTCDGADTPLPLSWSCVPEGTHELALTMRDPDATTGDFVHWAAAGIPPSSTSAAPKSAAVAIATLVGTYGR